MLPDIKKSEFYKGGGYQTQKSSTVVWNFENDQAQFG
jgi:hypothetical protein